MLYLLIIVFIVVIFLLIRLLSLKNEIKKIAKQLHDYNNQRTNKKIDIALLNHHIEHVGAEINNLIELHVKEKRERIRVESELKQTIANMSHDLRTPLTSIIGYIQMAESDGISEDEQREYLAIAKNRANRLEALLNDFFDLSLIESNEYQLKVERINVKNIMIDVLMGFFDRFNDKNMEPVINVPDSDVYMMTDKSAITRVIENLVSNAIKYSSGRKIIISLEEKNSVVNFIVQNEALMLTEENVNRLFDRFYMADQSRTGKSTGLGLSIVKSFMEKMNGNVNGHLEEGNLIITCEWKTN